MAHAHGGAAPCLAEARLHRGVRARPHEGVSAAPQKVVQANNITVEHIAGAVNLADMFTKEDKDVAHFVLVRNIIMRSPDDLV